MSLINKENEYPSCKKTELVPFSCKPGYLRVICYDCGYWEIRYIRPLSTTMGIAKKGNHMNGIERAINRL